MRTKLEIILALVLIIVSLLLGYNYGNKDKKIIYSGQYNFTDFELKENRPQKQLVFRMVNPDDYQDLLSRARAPIVVTMNVKRKAFFTHEIYGVASDGSKGADFSYDATTTPNWGLVAGATALVFVAGFFVAK